MKIKGSFSCSDLEFKFVREFTKTESQLWSSELLIWGFSGLPRASQVSTGACRRAAVPTGERIQKKLLNIQRDTVGPERKKVNTEPIVKKDEKKMDQDNLQAF